MIYPNVNVKTWCLKHKIDLSPLSCACGHRAIPNRAFLSKDHVGVDISQCSRCGQESPGSTFVYRDKKKNDEIMRMIFG